MFDISKFSILNKFRFCGILLGLALSIVAPSLVDAKDVHEISNDAFYKDFSDRAGTIGAIASSSKTLAKRMTKNLFLEAPNDGSLFTVIDVGAGDGVFTEEIANHLQEAGIENYRIYAVDIDDVFFETLKVRFENNKRIIPLKIDMKTAINAAQFGLPAEHKFDAIISGLPFYADCFSADDVALTFANYQILLKPNGLLRWISYISITAVVDVFHQYELTINALPLLLPEINKWVHQECEFDEAYKSYQNKVSLLETSHIQDDFKHKCAFIDNFKSDNHVTSEKVILNWPPAYVHEYRN